MAPRPPAAPAAADKDIDIGKVTPGARVALRNDSYTLHVLLPTKVDPLVSLMKVGGAGAGLLTDVHSSFRGWLRRMTAPPWVPSPPRGASEGRGGLAVGGRRRRAGPCWSV